jgi:predicted ATPase/DNA-binding SARP family transcriptional activator
MPPCGVRGIVTPSARLGLVSLPAGPWRRLRFALFVEGFGGIVRFRVLGIVGFESDDGALTEARGNARVLLAALAVTPNRAVTADLLIDSVWGESGVPKATLHVELSRLRTWIRNRGGNPEAIETTPAGYRLVAGVDDLDTSLMTALIREGEGALGRGDADTAVARLEQARELWGEPFVGLGYMAPFDAVASELREAGARADELLSEAHLAAGRADVGRLRRLVDEEPSREVRWQHLMLALYRDGRQADALRVFREAADHLAEVGLEPSRALVELEDGILSRDPGLDAISRLRLPAETSTFVGRRDEVDSLVELVGKRRIVCVTGPGGVGKSRLALRVAHQVASRYQDGAAFVSLAHVSESGTVPHSVAGTLGAGERPGVSVSDAIVTSLQGRSLLIVLDNCEHVADAAARMARLLAASSDGVTVITTSQHDLRIPGSAVWNLVPLAVPTTDWRAELQDNDAVKLFVERASERSRARLDDELVAVGSLCRRLDGIPLAIELAATLCSSRSVSEIVEMLETDQRVRVQATADGIEHHRSWHDSISWSLGLLDEVERTALGRLAVFRGGFDRRAALDVCSGGRIDRQMLDVLIDLLVDKSLLLVAHEDRGVRLSMLESVRLASLELVDPAERGRMAAAHRGYFAGRALEEGARIYLETAAAAAAIEADHDNIRSALGAAVTGDRELAVTADPELAATMVGVLMPYWTTQGHSSEAQRWADEVASLVDPATAPHVALSAGIAAAYNAHYGQSLAFLETAQRSLEAAGRKTLLGWARFQAGRALTVGVIAGVIESEALERGSHLLALARDRFAEKGDHHGAALVGMFAGVNAFLRLHVDADRLLFNALEDARRVTAVDVEAMALAMTALPRLREGEYRQACEQFMESAAALRRDRNWLNTQICTSLAAYAAAGCGYEEAGRLAGEACRLQIAFGSREWDALTLAVTAFVVHTIDREAAVRLVRCLDHHYPRWRQLVKGGFAELAPLLELGPGTPAPVLSPVEALRLAADLLG